MNIRKHTFKSLAASALATAALLIPTSASGAGTTATGSGVTVSKSSEWKHHLTVYLLGAAMDGTTAIGPISVDVDVSFSEIWDNLEFGAMANYRAEKGKLFFGLDVIYMGLGATTPTMTEVDVDQWMVEGTAGWRVTDAIELFAGVRYNDVGLSIDPLGLNLLPLSKSEGWYDPIVGARVWLPLGKSFTFIARGDVGGFGVGSDLTWQLAGHLQYAFSDSFSALVGYRYLYVDYQTGSGLTRFVYDMTVQGPDIGLSWRF